MWIGGERGGGGRAKLSKEFECPVITCIFCMRRASMMDNLFWLESGHNILLLCVIDQAVSCKMLVVVNEGLLFGAAGGKVHGQTAGDCGCGHAKINTIEVLAVTVRTSLLVDGFSFLREGWCEDLGCSWLLIV